MRALSSLQPAHAAPQKGKGRDKRANPGQSTSCFKIVKMIMERNYQPVIVFSFSKRECEAYLIRKKKAKL